MSSRVWLVALWLLVVSVLGAAQAGGSAEVLIERVEVVVEDLVITASELDAQTRIMLVWNGHVDLAWGRLPDDLRRGIRALLVEQMLVAAYAKRLGIGLPAPEKLEHALGRFRARFDSVSGYRRFLGQNGVAEVDVALVLGRAVYSGAVVQRRLLAERLGRRTVGGVADIGGSNELDVGRAGARRAQSGAGRARDWAVVGMDDGDRLWLRAWLDELGGTISVRTLNDAGELERWGRLNR